MRFLSTVISGLIPGLIAGLILGLLVLTFISPLIFSAEKYEGHSGRQMEGRSGQRNIATVLGTIIVGSAYGLILASAYELTAKRPPPPPIVRGLKFGLLGYFIFSFIPSLAFLPNPPGVEAQASPAVRQTWWLSIIILEVIGLFIYSLVFRRFQSRSRVHGHLFGLMSFIAIALIPFILGLPNGLDKIIIPAQLLILFRVASFATMLVFWLILGVLVGWFNGWLGQEVAP